MNIDNTIQEIKKGLEWASNVCEDNIPFVPVKLFEDVLEILEEYGRYWDCVYSTEYKQREEKNKE